MENLIHFTKDTLEHAVDGGGVVIVDFWATWCGPCRMIAPAIERLADDFAGRAMVGKVDVDQEGELAAGLGIMSIPCVIAFQNGVEYERLVGARPYSEYERLANEALD